MDDQGYVQVVLRVDFDRMPIYYDTITKTKFKIHISSWDPKLRTVKNNKILSTIIEKRKITIVDALLKYELDDVELNKNTIRSIINGNDPSKSFAATCHDIINKKYKNKATNMLMHATVNKLEAYQPGLSFADIDYKFLTNFNNYLRDELNNAPNTIWKQFKTMNTLFREAIKIGNLVKVNPFDTFNRGKYSNPDRVFLIPEEIERIEKLLDQPIPDHLVQVIKYFLLMVHSGLRFEDARVFNTKDHIRDNERILITTAKAKQVLNLKLYPRLRKLINILGPPLDLSNQKFNENLKTVAVMAGINKNLTAHVARHTFGMLLADKGIPLEIAQRLLAHKDIEATKVYYHLRAKILDDTIDKNFG